MDTAFYVVSGLIALALFVLIARNLYLLDKQDRRFGEAGRIEGAPPPEAPSDVNVGSDREAPPPTSVPPPTAAPGTTERGLSQEEIDLLRGGGEINSAIPTIGDQIGGEAPGPELHAGPPDAETPEPVEFSGYYPREVKPNVWTPFVAYVFRESAADAVADDVRDKLGDNLQNYRETAEPARQLLAEGTLITATPWLDGFQFNPPSITIGLYEPWQRLDFKLRADKAPLDQAVNGRITFTVEGIIVGDLLMSVFVTEKDRLSPTIIDRRKPYNAIFCSYSRKDMAIVQRVERAYRALGSTYMRDMVSLRSGEDWSDALKTLIDEADVFQLFWSNNSCISSHCKMEWDYALTLAAQRDHFIRPVYWENPLPPVPDSLRNLHFAYEPELGS